MVNAIHLLLFFVAITAVELQSVRECSCDEMTQCVSDLKGQLFQCFETCWIHFNQLTPRPAELHQCFEKKYDIAESIISCFRDNAVGCVKNRNGPLIPRQEFESMFRRTEANVRTRGQNAIKTALLAPLQKVFNAAISFYDCSKTCFLEKNHGGICLKKYGCQPLLPTEAKSKGVFISCLNHNGVDLKKEGGALCNCAVAAGVSDVKLYCPLLQHLSSKTAASITRSPSQSG